jgi:prepilin-type N-terminal cleavage/methylation domain-containing protein
VFSGRKGLTLIELLIVMAIIGILATILIPNIQAALNKSKQKNTMKDISAISAALMDYVTQNEVAPAQDGTYGGGDPFIQALSPLYIEVLPLKDRWGNPFRIWCGSAATHYGISQPESGDFLIASFGRDDKQDDFVFDPDAPEKGIYALSSMKDFDKDLVLWNGTWIHGPGTRSGGGSGEDGRKDGCSPPF